MDPDEAFVLASEVTVVAVGDLDPVLQAQIDAEDGDFAITKEHSRRTTRLIDRAGAELLEEFRAASSIPDALQRYSARTGRVPMDVLNQSFDLLARMVKDEFLMPAAARSVSAMGAVESAGGWQPLEPLRQLDDTEVFLVRGPDGGRGVLKRVSPRAEAWVHVALRNEAIALHQLAGNGAPELLEEGVDAETPYLVVAWRPGLTSELAAAHVRRPWLSETRAPLAVMCTSVLTRYAELHEHGFLHGDVQPTNVLLDPGTGDASLVDFGLAVRVGEQQPSRLRGGVATFITPEWAGSALRGEHPPTPTPASEQYAVAALVYRLLAGHDYLERRLDPDAWHRAVCTEPPRAFVRHGIPPWPEIEAVLHRALSKDPAARYASVAELRDAFADAAQRSLVGPGRPSTAQPWTPPGLVDAAIGRLAEDAEVRRPLPRPTASVNLGAAGIASFLLRASGLTERGDLLAAADLWIERAKRDAVTSYDDAFADPSRGLDEDTVGRASLYHSPVGVHLVDAQIALALDQRSRASEAIGRLVTASERSDPRADVVTGAAGRLIAFATLLETAAAVGVDDERDRLRALGDKTTGALLDPLDGVEEAVPGTGEPFLGVAHGWAGVAYALLRYLRAAGEPVPESVRGLLRALAGEAQRDAGAVSWSIGSMNEGLEAGWCHGTTGHTLLWSEVHSTEALPDVDALELALAAGEHVWRHPSPGAGQLCCGAAGQGYAFLALSRLTGDGVHVGRARDRLDHAVGFVGTRGMLPNSLYKGDLGVALLELEIAEPYLAAMPMFEPERWGAVAR
ncbi:MULTISPECIES: lanthionine synthetase LanC family protein [Mumia]|nr:MULTISPECIES: lanthionine synthetase LanC family protein [Mumia]